MIVDQQHYVVHHYQQSDPVSIRSFPTVIPPYIERARPCSCRLLRNVEGPIPPMLFHCRQSGPQSMRICTIKDSHRDCSPPDERRLVHRRVRVVRTTSQASMRQISAHRFEDMTLLVEKEKKDNLDQHLLKTLLLASWAKGIRMPRPMVAP